MRDFSNEPRTTIEQIRFHIACMFMTISARETAKELEVNKKDFPILKKCFPEIKRRFGKLWGAKIIFSNCANMTVRGGPGVWTQSLCPHTLIKLHDTYLDNTDYHLGLSDEVLRAFRKGKSYPPK